VSLSSRSALFLVEPSSGTLRAANKESIHFMFDYSRYLLLKAGDAERRVLQVGQWIEASARITMKGGFAAPFLAISQVIDVKLRVYVE
jgi:hypothetical protein